MYQVTIKKHALRSLEDIQEPYFSNIQADICSLAKDPTPPGYKKLKGRNGYRIRASDYRIIYEVFDKVLLIDVINLGHRKDIYS